MLIDIFPSLELNRKILIVDYNGKYLNMMCKIVSYKVNLKYLPSTSNKIVPAIIRHINDFCIPDASFVFDGLLDFGPLF